MKTIYIMLMMLPVLLISCEKDENEPAGKVIHVTKTTQEIILADNDFGLSLFKTIVDSGNESGNIFISPTSVALALAMTYNGADGETSTAMKNTLRKTGFSLDEINQSYSSLMDALVSVDPRVKLEIANSIWYRQGFSVLQNFIDVNTTYYHAEVNSLNFSDASSVDVINGWVNEKTHEKIRTIIQEISPANIMYLINAIYFKGIWRSEFDKAKTGDQSFTNGNGEQVLVPTMQQQDTFRYVHDNLVSCLELPYGSGNYNMVILLPDYNADLSAIVDELTPEYWNSLMDKLTLQEVVLYLPRFKFEYENTLNDALTDMGMGIAFTGNADFSKINGTGGLYISKVIHKAFVEVNEEGTEAAAVTAVIFDLDSGGPDPEPVIFNVDHPFIFAIRERDTGAIVFIGLVKNPVQ